MATAAVLPHLLPPMPRSPTMPMKPALGARILCGPGGSGAAQQAAQQAVQQAVQQAGSGCA
jgi:hypothetical protein